MSIFYHDVHMHLDLYKDVDNIIKYIEKNKSYTIAVTNLPILYKRLTLKYPNLRYIRFALGLHPELIKQYPEQIPVLFEKIKEARYIGEIGLDFQGLKLEERNLQISTFEKIIRLCDGYGGKILSIHSRGTAKQVNEIIGANFNGKVIMHWFSGSMSELKTAIESGFYFSININMIQSKKGRELISEMPLSRILIESDAPFTRGSSVDYNISFIEDIINTLSTLKNLKSEVIFRILKNNFKLVLS